MAPEMTSVQTDSVETRRKTTRNRDFGKGKKRDIKRNIPSDLIPIEEETWLLQPIAVTMMRHDYSLRKSSLTQSSTMMDAWKSRHSSRHLAWIPITILNCARA